MNAADQIVAEAVCQIAGCLSGLLAYLLVQIRDERLR